MDVQCRLSREPLDSFGRFTSGVMAPRSSLSATTSSLFETRLESKLALGRVTSIELWLFVNSTGCEVNFVALKMEFGSTNKSRDMRRVL